MKNVPLSLLESLCAGYGSDMGRPDLDYPFIQGENVIAHDGKVLVSVPIEDVSSRKKIEVLPMRDKPNVANVFWDESLSDYKASFTLDRIQKALDSCPQEDVYDPENPQYIVCAECNGSGEVLAEYCRRNGSLYSAPVECPACHGKGRVPNPNAKKIGSGPVYQSFICAGIFNFRAKLISQVLSVAQALGAQEVTLMQRREVDSRVFATLVSFSKGDEVSKTRMIIMPCLIENVDVILN